jgi:hypothetical protein
MEAIPTWNLWLAWLIAIIAILGWTYKLNRDLRLDMKSMLDQYQTESKDYIANHHHDDTGAVMVRMLVRR